MLRSMTGYGTGSYQSEDTTVAVEVRTVNHRFLDVHIRIPREYSFLEPDIHQLVKKARGRGNLRSMPVSFAATWRRRRSLRRTFN